MSIGIRIPTIKEETQELMSIGEALLRLHRYQRNLLVQYERENYHQWERINSPTSLKSQCRLNDEENRNGSASKKSNDHDGAIGHVLDPNP